MIDEQNIIAVNNVIPTKCLAVLIPPVVNPVINACFGVDGTQIPYSPSDPWCASDAAHTGSGDCNGKTLAACSGNCNGANVCGPVTTGCSGNCNNTFIYNSPCSGNCEKATIYLLPSGATVDTACASNCKNATIIVPMSWATRPTTCSSGVCVCRGSCSGITVSYY